MDKQNFKRLVKALKTEFTPNTGAVAHCVGRPNKGLTICCSSIDNQGFVPQMCIVWHQGDLKYFGALDRYKLRMLLDRWGVCRATVTNVFDMQAGIKRTPICLADKCTCKNKKCMIRKEYLNEQKISDSKNNSVAAAD